MVLCLTACTNNNGMGFVLSQVEFSFMTLTPIHELQNLMQSEAIAESEHREAEQGEERYKILERVQKFYCEWVLFLNM